MGSRYMVAMVKMDDEDKPIEPPEVTEGKRAVQMAGLLCKEPKFQNWLVQYGEAFEVSEKEASATIIEMLSINSRADLRTDSRARERFFDIVEHFKKGVKYDQ